METFKQFIRPFCKLEKSITYLKFGCSYRCGNTFRKTMMTRHILIPVRIFFILGRQFAPSRESRTHVLKFLARTLNYICFVLSMFLNMVILYPAKLHKFFSYSRFAVRHTEKYIIITDMYRIVQYY